MKSVYGPIYDFSPSGFNLPLEYTKLAAECNRNKLLSCSDPDKLAIEENPIWICKPVSKSQGRGIFLFRKLSELNYDTNTIVQRYIDRPLLIGGYKFDLRLYVCIPSYHPMAVYMYKEGLARFGTDKFNLHDLTNPFRHLTNCSINKLGPNYTEMKDRVGAGCKWTLKHLRRYFVQAGINDWLLWQKISAMVVLTILSHSTQVPASTNCFDFFGFDILIDERLKPWLLEVNLSPALSNDCDADRTVKKPMLHDMFDLLGLPLHNTGLGTFDISKRSSNRLGSDDENAKSGDEALSSPKKDQLSEKEPEHRHWRRKKKKRSSRSKVKSNYEIKQPQRKTISIVQKTLFLDNSKLRTDEWKRDKMNVWGNGRDWRYPKASEGDWIRIWPIHIDRNLIKQSTPNELRKVKDVVVEISKFTRVAKENFKKFPNASDRFLGQLQRKELFASNLEIWTPPL